jgi:hypothetical protein
MNRPRKTAISLRRESPALCLIFGTFFGIFGLLFPYVASLDVASKSELQSVSGSVEQIYRKHVSRGSEKIDILVLGSDRIHHLTQDDFTDRVPEILTLKAGDKVTAKVKPDSMGRDLEWFWELKRNGVSILSFEATREYFERRGIHNTKLTLAAGVVSICLFALGFVLKRHFGAWRDAT